MLWKNYVNKKSPKKWCWSTGQYRSCIVMKSKVSKIGQINWNYPQKFTKIWGNFCIIETNLILSSEVLYQKWSFWHLGMLGTFTKMEHLFKYTIYPSLGSPYSKKPSSFRAIFHVCVDQWSSSYSFNIPVVKISHFVL